MAAIALFPGSFDPVTNGHIDIINRSLDLFERIIIGVGNNSTKQTMFTIDERVMWIKETFSGNKKIEVTSYEGLTVSFAKKCGAGYILRGLRSSSDFEFERSIGQMNLYMENSIETVFILASPRFTPVSSTIVRDIIRHGGDVKQFVPAAVKTGSN
jgi:pantetheine-phosphate adenylyltransferase